MSTVLSLPETTFPLYRKRAYRFVFSTVPILLLLLSCACSTLQPTAVTPSRERLVIITADDFGAAPNINEGIWFAAEQGAISAVSAMTNFRESLPELKALAEAHPDIGIGVHLNIVSGSPILSPAEVLSLVNEEGRFYTIEELLPRIKKIAPDDLRKELTAQVEALKKLDIPIDHLSDHFGILSLYSPFFEIVAELAESCGVPVRSPVLASVRYPKVFSHSTLKKKGRQLAFQLARRTPFKALGFLRFTRLKEMERKARSLTERRIACPDLLVDSFWGEPTAANFRHILQHLPPGTSEIVVHLGTYSRQAPPPSGIDTGYYDNREFELITTTSLFLKAYFPQMNIRMVGYSELNRKSRQPETENAYSPKPMYHVWTHEPKFVRPARRSPGTLPPAPLRHLQSHRDPIPPTGAAVPQF